MGVKVHEKTIVLFFSYGISLADWKRGGLLERQRLLFETLSKAFDLIVLVTYGDQQDRGIPIASSVDVCIKPSWCPRVAYAFLAPWLHRRAIRQANICYTFQLSGAIPGLVAKGLFRKPLVVHCGFPWRAFACQQHRFDLVIVAWLVERLACAFANAILTTADYGLRAASLTIIPNGVDLERFRPNGQHQRGLICWVGRMDRQKNLELLFRAVVGLPGVTLRLIGDGPERKRLDQLAAKLQVPVEWIGNVANDDVPRYLRDAEMFVFPSQYEGDPKALVEAMACGLPVIASDIPAHRTIIQPEVNGLLSPLDSPALRGCIERILKDREFALRLGQEARVWVETHRDLRTLLMQECCVLERVVQNGSAG